jgi:hypothetical protein
MVLLMGVVIISATTASRVGRVGGVGCGWRWVKTRRLLLAMMGVISTTTALSKLAACPPSAVDILTTVGASRVVVAAVVDVATVSLVGWIWVLLMMVLVVNGMGWEAAVVACIMVVLPIRGKVDVGTTATLVWRGRARRGMRESRWWLLLLLRVWLLLMVRGSSSSSGSPLKGLGEWGAGDRCAGRVGIATRRVWYRLPTTTTLVMLVRWGEVSTAVIERDRGTASTLLMMMRLVWWWRR